MRIDITLSERAKGLIAQHTKAGGKITSALLAGLREAMTATAKYIQVEKLSGQDLTPRTGALRKSIDFSVEREADRITGRVGPRSDTVQKYAAMMEFGGTILPKKGRMLAVPLPAAMTGSGVIKGQYNVEDLHTLPLCLIKRKGGTRAYLADVRDLRAGIKITPLFVLVPSVTIAGRHYMQQAADWLRPKIIGYLKAALERSLVDKWGIFKDEG